MPCLDSEMGEDRKPLEEKDVQDRSSQVKSRQGKTRQYKARHRKARQNETHCPHVTHQDKLNVEYGCWRYD